MRAKHTSNSVLCLHSFDLKESLRMAVRCRNNSRLIVVINCILLRVFSCLCISYKVMHGMNNVQLNNLS
jgi:hypothetical protein